MPKLYLNEYKQSLIGRTIFIACREGILRDYFTDIAADIKFLVRQGICTVLFHNMSNRVANQKHFHSLKAKLPNTEIIRAPFNQDFYNYVLNYNEKVFKIIFLERKFLIDNKGQKINILTTMRARHRIINYVDLIGNVNFKGIIDRICHKIENKKIERVHILPAGKNTIKHELFSIEGTGTLIANNFTETFGSISTDEEVSVVVDILKICFKEGYLKQRPKHYVSEHRNNFFAARIDGITVGCFEKIIINPTTVELGAMAVSTKFRSQQIGLFLINSFIKESKNQAFNKIISLTNNLKLQNLYKSLGFKKTSPPEFRERQKLSPNVSMFLKEI
ncbi:GNAT family N-acetyltransferase [Candidatus Magnetomoraceae bacterium gMMP-15]